ncbi:MAG: cell envelope integrity protein TolA [Anaplasma sp.]
MLIRVVREALLNNVHVVLSILLHVAIGAVYLAGAWFAERGGAQRGSSNPMVVLSPLLEETSPEEQSITQKHDAEHAALQERIERIAEQIAERSDEQVVEEVRKPAQEIPKPPSRKKAMEEGQAAQQALSVEALVGDQSQADSPEEELANILQTVRAVRGEAEQEQVVDERDPALEIVSTIKSRFVECWTVPAGAKDIEDIVVKVNLVLAPSGKVIRANVVDTRMYNRDPFFRAMADSALRAVYKCSPLSELKTTSYNLWREIVLTFNPKPMVAQKQAKGGNKASEA